MPCPASLLVTYTICSCEKALEFAQLKMLGDVFNITDRMFVTFISPELFVV